MITEVCQVQATGMRMSIQDMGRPGWARFGVPVSGAMDQHAAAWANRLLGNDPTLPVLEMPGRGARLKFVQETWIAVTGAHTVADAMAWRALPVHAGDTLAFSEAGHGLWTYMAVETGFHGPRWLGSASVYARGGLGRLLEPGAVLSRTGRSRFSLPAGISGRVAPWTEQRDYGKPPALRVWPAPQWELFSVPQRDQFFQEEWTVSPQSDRSGYRLAGVPIEHELGDLLSEPVLVGTIQVPPNGEPIVTMRDGPTVGGYAKLGVVDPADISWLAQIQPGQRVRFRPCNLT
jgi:biotin-dependent carboxylase-like uncharacterized protein